MNSIIKYKYKTSDKLFWVSDTHFSHKNIMKYCERPFDSVEEMNETIISNWNKVVEPDATVFHLGDFAFGTILQWEEIRNRLNGTIHLILGNHDFRIYTNNRERLKQMFATVTMQQVIEVGKHKILMNHYPFLTYSGIYRDKHPSWELFGHTHLKPNSSGADMSRLQYALSTQYEVGVDLNNFTPISFEEIKDKIQAQIQAGKNALMWT